MSDEERETESRPGDDSPGNRASTFSGATGRGFAAAVLAVPLSLLLTPALAGRFDVGPLLGVAVYSATGAGLVLLLATLDWLTARD